MRELPYCQPKLCRYLPRVDILIHFTGVTLVMANIEIYSSHFCGYCVMAQRLLDSKDVEYTVYHVDTEAGRREEMQQRSNGQRSVPQIFINDQHIGGFTDLAQLDREGGLEQLQSTG